MSPRKLIIKEGNARVANCAKITLEVKTSELQLGNGLLSETSYRQVYPDIHNYKELVSRCSKFLCLVSPLDIFSFGMYFHTVGKRAREFSS